MITGLVLADGGEEELAMTLLGTTLGALVPAVVEGLMGDAVVIARQRAPAMGKLVEATGATLVVVSRGGDPWRAGAAAARREWLLCLDAGDMPGEGWIRAVDRFLATAKPGGPRLGRFSPQWRGAASAVIGFAERLGGTRSVRAGDLVRRDWFAADGGRVRPVRIRAAIRRDLEGG